MILLKNKTKLSVKVSKLSKAAMGILFAAVLIIPSMAACPVSNAYGVENDDQEVEVISRRLNDCFPDESFAQYVYESILGRQDWENEGAAYNLNYYDIVYIHNVEDINIAGINCRNLTGIQNFIKLKSLDCSNNALQELDVSSCDKLEELICDNNLINNLNVAGCTNLKKLYCRENPTMQDLSVSNCDNLEELNVERCYMLRKVQADNCYLLSEFRCAETGIEELDMSNFPCMTTLDVSACVGLRKLNVSGCRFLAELKVENCPLLTTISCARTNIEHLNIATCPSVSQLDVSDCEALANIYGLRPGLQINMDRAELLRRNLEASDLDQLELIHDHI